jgi:heme oxygenase
MSLKEITKDLHHNAERTTFAKKLLSGEISKEDYTRYLLQLTAIYGLIEQSCKEQGFLKNLEGIERATSIKQDFDELMDGSNVHDYEHYEYHNLLPSTIKYRNYINELIVDSTRKHLIKAHMYCRHMGDLFGGQIIKKKVAHISKGKFYDFDNVEELKGAIRAELTDDLGSEARVAFEFAIEMMKELNDE